MAQGGENANKNSDTISSFKAAQTRYRQRPKNDGEWRKIVSKVIDFSNPQQQFHEKYPVTEFKCLPELNEYDKTTFQGKDVPFPKKVYTLHEFPGLLYAPGALSEDVQLELAYLALTQYCEAPHHTNIDLVPPRHNEYSNKNESMWKLWMDQQQKLMNDKNKKPRKHPNSATEKRPHRSMKKLSWSTMGYHYDWTVRTYREDSKSDVPEGLGQLSQMFASYYGTRNHSQQLNQDNHNASSSSQNATNKYPFFNPTACIVNYYNLKSIMGGHSDNLELTFDKPVISISMGLPAIFLLGGATKEDGPVVPILIRPGDVLMLGGESRLRYHGMARVLDQSEIMRFDLEQKIIRNDVVEENSPGASISEVELGKKELCNPEKQFNQSSSHSEPFSNGLKNDLEFVRSFLSMHRININVRQVLPDGVLRIPDDKPNIDIPSETVHFEGRKKARA